jgi:hypothetical protein
MSCHRIVTPRAMLAGFLLLLAGCLLLPLQIALQKECRVAGLRTAPVTRELREQIGQSGFLAALSGFRAPLAACLWIEAHTAWEKTEWGRMAGLFNTVTALQPRNLLYWDTASWHMAWNASAASLLDKRVQSAALRERSARQYVFLGRDFLERGIRNNPGEPLLYERLGMLLRDKEQDHPGAADAFSEAASLPNAPGYLRRFAAYETALSPGREQEAYRRLLELYNEGEKQRVPTLLLRLRELEEKLHVPADRRIPSSGFPEASARNRATPAEQGHP